ncbi:hypothetical protein LCL61_11235 [Amycolatopsis coloradensis]|uniref:Uncharacterized protein n=1 Tax=Amycolatopsis coloradensis TaxID=76021 RepID=A0ACD5BA15_9PSEU
MNGKTGRWIGGVALILAPLVWFAGLLLRHPVLKDLTPEHAAFAALAALVVFVSTFLVDARAVSGPAERILPVAFLRGGGFVMQPRATLSFVARTSFPCRDLARQRRTCGRSGCGDRGEPCFGA